MAMYKYSKYVEQVNDDIFDQEHKPGEAAVRSGIFRCLGCGREVASNQGEPLPPQNEYQHPHTTANGAVRWKLAVYADHRPK